MAIKITKPGQKEFHGFCKWCGCQFTYEISDLKLSATGDKLDCPTCGKTYHHPSMVQDPTIPGGIWPLQTLPFETYNDPCEGCAWKDNLGKLGTYVGDTPCTWCAKKQITNLVAGVPLEIQQEPYMTLCTDNATLTNQIFPHGDSTCSTDDITHRCNVTVSKSNLND